MVDAETRNRWVIEAARQTLGRIDDFEGSDNQHATMAREQYGKDIERYREAAVEALERLGSDDAEPEDGSTTDDEADE